MTERLYVTCPACNREQPSMIQMDRAAFKSSTIEGNSQSCAECGTPILLSKDTAYFKDDESS